MRLYIEDTHTFPDALRPQLQGAFDRFDQIVEHYATLADQIEDLDLALDLRQLTLTFTGTITCADNEWPRYYAHHAVELMGKFASTVAWESDLPRAVATRRTQISAEDDSFTACATLTFTIPQTA